MFNKDNYGEKERLEIDYDRCETCKSLFYNQGNYLDCIYCWYDKLYHKSLVRTKLTSPSVRES